MLQAQGLTKIFVTPTGEDLIAVNNVSFSCRPGEIYGLLGPNGAGKTTTLRMLVGLMTPTAGRVTVNGMGMSENPRAAKSRLGYLASGAGLYARLTPREVFRYFGNLYGMKGAALERRIEQVVGLLDMARYANRRCEGLSTGESQRVHIGRTILHDPAALILDEPTLGLDVLSNRVILDFVRGERARGKAVLMSTHYLDEAETLCDRFGLLHRGRLLADGALAELRACFGRQRLTEIFLDLAEQPGGSTVIPVRPAPDKEAPAPGGEPGAGGRA